MKPILNTQLHTIAVSGRSDARSLCILDLHQPTSAQQEMGRFFTLFELEHSSESLIKQYTDLARFLGEYYYEQHIPERNHFEDTIMHANGLLKHLADAEQADVHAIIGLFTGSHIAFSTHGSPDVWLFLARSRQVHHLSAEHQDTETFFGELVEGTLGVQDVIFLSSSHVKDYYTSDRLAKIVHGHNGAEIARHLQRSISELGSSLSFAGVLAEARPAAVVKTKEKPRGGSHASIETLLRGQDITDELLEPTVIKNTRVWFKEQWRKRPNASHKKSHTPRAMRPETESSFLFGHTLVYLLRTGGILITRLAQSSVVAIWRVGRVTTAMIKSSPSGRSKASAALGQNVGSTMQGFRNRYTALTRKKRVWYGAMAVLLLVGIIGGSVWSWSAYGQKKGELFDKAITSASTLLEEANAATIYGAQAQAHQLLEQAHQNLLEIKPRGSQQRIAHEDLLAIIKDAQKGLRKEVPIIAQRLADIPDTLIAGSRSLTFYEDQLLITSATQSKSITSTLSGQLGQPQDTSAPLINAQQGEQNLIGRSGNDLFEFSPPKASKLTSLENLTDFALFSNRVYTLYAASGRIETHRLSNTGLSQKGNPWLQNSVLFPLNARYIVVDGSIYIIGTGGSVTKLQKGQVVPFTLTPAQPAIDNINAIWSNIDSQYLYFLESSQNRIMAYSKDGKLVAQYLSDELALATDFHVHEERKTAYFITDKNLQSFTLSHIN